MFHRPDEAIVHLEIATARNPNDAHAMAVLGWQLWPAAMPTPAAIGLIETARGSRPASPPVSDCGRLIGPPPICFMLNHADGLNRGRAASDRTHTELLSTPT